MQEQVHIGNIPVTVQSLFTLTLIFFEVLLHLGEYSRLFDQIQCRCCQNLRSIENRFMGSGTFPCVYIILGMG